MLLLVVFRLNFKRVTIIIAEILIQPETYNKNVERRTDVRTDGYRQSIERSWCGNEAKNYAVNKKVQF